MISKPKSNSVITHNVEGEKVTFNVTGAGAVTLDLGKVAEACRNRAMVHGFIQRVSDAAAMSRDQETGKPATPEEKLAAMTALVEHYESGTAEWGRKREAGAGEGQGLLYRALCVMYPGKKPEDIRKFVAGKSRAEKMALLNAPKVREIVDGFRAEAGKGVNTEELLAGL